MGRFQWIGVIGVVGALTFASVAWGKDRAPALQTLVESSHDLDERNRSYFAVATDPQGDFLYLAYWEDLSQAPREVTLEEIARGVVLVDVREKNLEVLRLEADGPVSPKEGGRLRLYFLHNGLTRSYHYFSFEAVREGGQWGAYPVRGGAREGRPFTRMYFKTRRFLRKVIGIDYIEVE
jgi:hypothetical protein